MIPPKRYRIAAFRPITVDVPQTLLLADDNATSQRVIELTFADEDITVIAVSDGDQAIAQLNAAPPDIVLADVGMPGKSGYDVAEYVKTTPRLAHIPVVLLTGAFEPVDQVKAAAVGCDSVLSKPFEPQLVIGRVRELLGRSAQTAAVAVAPSFAPAAEAAPAPATETPTRVGDYFDRLDAALSSLVQNAVPAPAAEEIDWITPRPQEDEVAAPAVTLAVELPVVEPEPLDPVAPLEPLAPVEPLERSSSAPRALPAIADAFAAILAAEQHAPGVRPEWPAASAAPSPAVAAAPVITDDLVALVASRVLEQLSDRIVRETVATIASDVAERLVKEEIERIKASIK
jgi:CheY-like chemotaxis protein